ncbi:hypothetical protein FOA52_008520 [Chlamydomonas sp. UWO 241]|nr:hypothetical protein FOA52_008520 [Chlamydomonas sp. UWO 241]
MGPGVLLNDLLFAQMWGHLRTCDKKQLRAVGRGVKALVDDLVVTLTMRGIPAADLGSALALWSKGWACAQSQVKRGRFQVLCAG